MNGHGWGYDAGYRAGRGWSFGNWDDRSGIHARYGSDFGGPGRRYARDYGSGYRRGGGDPDEGWGMEWMANQYWNRPARYDRDYDAGYSAWGRPVPGLRAWGRRDRGAYGVDYPPAGRFRGGPSGYRGWRNGSG